MEPEVMERVLPFLSVNFWGFALSALIPFVTFVLLAVGLDIIHIEFVSTVVWGARTTVGKLNLMWLRPAVLSRTWFSRAKKEPIDIEHSPVSNQQRVSSP